MLVENIGTYGAYSQANGLYESIRKILMKEYGIANYLSADYYNPQDDIFNFFLNTNYVECIDIIEIFFRWIGQKKHDGKQVIEELNTRFKMQGVGYEFVDGKIIRIDSELTHQEIIKPTLGFLRDIKHFKGANEEFLKAHEFYRNKQYKQSVTECTKAFESCMKGICEKRGWKYEKSWPAKKLIETCLANNLIPSYMQDHLTQLRGLLESTATPRNKDAAHGQGADIKEVPEELASYALHLTASNILFLVECEKKLR